jgi:hypothetical protein
MVQTLISLKENNQAQIFFKKLITITIETSQRPTLSPTPTPRANKHVPSSGYVELLSMVPRK